jgi:hypothetical protein
MSAFGVFRKSYKLLRRRRYTIYGMDLSANSVLGCRFLISSLHTLHSAIRQGKISFGQLVSDRVFIAYICKDVFEGICVGFPICPLSAIFSRLFQCLLAGIVPRPIL